MTSDEVYLGGFLGLAERRGLAYFADYGLFVTMRAFGQVSGAPDLQSRSAEFQEKLSEHRPA